jgi:hypothetical protein
MHPEFAPVKFAMQPARLCIGKSKPAGGNTQAKHGDWRVARGENQKPQPKSGHSIQLSRMLREQALLGILHGQFPQSKKLCQ